MTPPDIKEVRIKYSGVHLLVKARFVLEGAPRHEVSIERMTDGYPETEFWSVADDADHADRMFRKAVISALGMVGLEPS